MVTRTQARARLAATIQAGAPAPVVEELRRDLRAAVAANHIRELVALDPPLTADQRDELAAILTGATTAA